MGRGKRAGEISYAMVLATEKRLRTAKLYCAAGGWEGDLRYYGGPRPVNLYQTICSISELYDQQMSVECNLSLASPTTDPTFDLCLPWFKLL